MLVFIKSFSWGNLFFVCFFVVIWVFSAVVFGWFVHGCNGCWDTLSSCLVWDVLILEVVGGLLLESCFWQVVLEYGWWSLFQFSFEYGFLKLLILLRFKGYLTVKHYLVVCLGGEGLVLFSRFVLALFFDLRYRKFDRGLTCFLPQSCFAMVVVIIALKNPNPKAAPKMKTLRLYSASNFNSSFMKNLFVRCLWSWEFLLSSPFPFCPVSKEL